MEYSQYLQNTIIEEYPCAIHIHKLIRDGADIARVIQAIGAENRLLDIEDMDYDMSLLKAGTKLKESVLATNSSRRLDLMFGLTALLA